MPLPFFASCIGVVLCVLAARAESADQKLIEFGWDEPDPAFMRAHLGEMERTPFDGCVFHVDATNASGGTSRFTWEGWGTRAFTEAELQHAVDDLRALKPGRLKHNFLRFNTTPGRIDWFDNHAAVIANARLAAEVARAGPCDGVLFDIEQYEGQLFDYRKQRDAGTKSWEQYAEQARKRGREVMEAFQAGYPNLTVLLTYGYSLPWHESQAGRKPLADCSYGLLAPFIDGLVEGAAAGVKIVDGYELSYGYKEPRQFAEAAETMRRGLLPIVKDREKYARLLSIGFGIWMDRNWREVGWNTEDFAKNHFTPATFETSVRAALMNADEYVWIYTETPRWWSPEGKPVKLPAAYDAALRAAREPEKPTSLEIKKPATSGAEAPATLPQHVWIEAETFAPLKGSNFSFHHPAKQQSGAWGVSGPGVADAWTQGGESEWMSIAAKADEPAGVTAAREVEIPTAGTYALWVRYSDYRGKREEFGARIRQGDTTWEQKFGSRAVVDELDPMKLLWEWSFAWDKADVPLQAGSARVELFTTGPTEERRQVDSLCLTTDSSYRPRGREKPDFATWRELRRVRGTLANSVEPLAKRRVAELPAPWRIDEKPPAFLWNVGSPWAAELAKPVAERVDEPFSVDEPLLKDFLAAHRGKPPRIYSEALSGPVWHIPQYPTAFRNGSPAIDWLARHPNRPFGVLLNYGDPQWGKEDDRAAARVNFARFSPQFQGYIAGESISHTGYDSAQLEAKVRAAKSRADVLVALREVHTASVVKKFGDYYGAPMTPEAAWADVVSCLSANMEAFAHALPEWGCKRIGHENTGNSPTLARRLAFLRGAARQFGVKLLDYQSCNLGDAATMFSRQAYFYPASSRYVLDNSYDAFAGAGVNWLWKDYILWHLAGVSAFYNEQGVDLFWKPGGNSAGDDFPVQLSPKGKVAEAALQLATKHPRGSQWTPIAFLVDQAHGWAQERFTPGSFGMDPQLNPAVLMPGRHEANLRGWFDIAYFPAPETQNEPATAARQTYVNGIFGDIFDVIAAAPGREAIVTTYPVVIMAGEVPLNAAWGKALTDYIENGGTLVVCADQCSGEGVAALGLPKGDRRMAAGRFTWLPGQTEIASGAFQFEPLTDKPAGTRPLAQVSGEASADLAVLIPRGKGQLIYVGIPLGLGLDERPHPVLALLMRHLVQGLAPVQAIGDVEWVLNRLDDRRWLIALLNNAGIEKPQHGINPTRHEETRTVKLHADSAIAEAREWLTSEPVEWRNGENGADAEITVPPGAVRLIEVVTSR